MEKFDFSKIENKEEAKWKRMLVTVEIEGKKKNVWVNYIVEAKESEGYCKFCNRENKKGLIENIKEIKVESDNLPEINQATEKIKKLVSMVESRMFICGDCFGQDFIEKRKGIYLEVLKEVQKELGIEIDEKQDEEIKNNE